MTPAQFERLLALEVLEILEEERALEEAGRLLRAQRERIVGLTPEERRKELEWWSATPTSRLTACIATG
jgi:hypothetical protein